MGAGGAIVDVELDLPRSLCSFSPTFERLVVVIVVVIIIIIIDVVVIVVNIIVVVVIFIVVTVVGTKRGLIKLFIAKRRNLPEAIKKLLEASRS